MLRWWLGRSVGLLVLFFFFFVFFFSGIFREFLVGFAREGGRRNIKGRGRKDGC